MQLQFDKAQPIRGYATETYARSVLRSLLSDEEYKGGDVVVMQELLRTRWCQRLTELRDFGWRPMQDPTRFYHACNCAPCGLTFGFRLRSCNFRQLCPDCWGKSRSLPGYRRFVSACFDGDSQHPRKGLYLAEFKWEEHLPRQKGVIKSVFERMQDEDSRWHRRWEVDHLSNVGAMVLHDFYPMPGYNVYVRRGLLLTRSAKLKLSEDDPVQPRGFSLWHDDLKFRYNIRDAVARVCRYPARLMTCPISDLGAYLCGVAGQKLFGFYGRLRDRHS